MTLKNNKPTLKLKHQYHIQCQSTIALTELNTIDFMVYAQKVCIYKLQDLMKENGKNSISQS